MKNTILSAVIGGLLCLAFVSVGRGSPETQSATAVGRYQLVSGRYPVHVKSSTEFNQDGLFKIDTQTGEVWEYGVLFDQAKGVKTASWTPLADNH